MLQTVFTIQHSSFFSLYGNWIKCLKNQPFDVIKMRNMRGEVGMKTPKYMDNPSFYDVTWLIFTDTYKKDSLLHTLRLSKRVGT